MPPPDRDPDDPRDDDDDGSGGGSGGPFAAAVVAVIVSILVLFGFIGGIKSNFPNPAPAAPCHTECWAFVKLECPTNRMIGACFGFWFCDKEAHVCGRDP